MSEAVELEPCPFCGGEAKVITPANSAPYGLCLRCHAGGPVNSTATPDEAVTAWNRRALNPGEGEPVAWRHRPIDSEGLHSPKWAYSDTAVQRVIANGPYLGVEVQPLYTRPVACSDREAVIACIRDAADRAFEAGRQGDIHFRFGDIIARADALLSGGGE